MMMLESLVPGVAALPIIRPVPGVELAIPVVVVILQDGDGSPKGGAGDGGPGPIQLPADSRNLRHPSIRAITVVVDPVPVDLGAECGGAPAKIEHQIGAVRDRLVGPQTQL